MNMPATAIKQETPSPISDEHFQTMMAYAQKGDIDGVKLGFRAVPSTQHVPLEAIGNILEKLSEHHVNPHEREGFVFGSGRFNHFRKGINYRPYLDNFKDENKQFASIGHTHGAIFHEMYGTLLEAHVIKALKAEQSNISVEQALHGYTDDNGEIVNGLWDDISRGFAKSAHGHVVTITPWADKNRIFMRTELPELLKNENVETINGLDRERFLQRFNDFKEDGLSDEDAYERLNDAYIKPTSANILFEYSEAFANDLAPPLRLDFRKRTDEGFDGWVSNAIPIAKGEKPVHFALDAVDDKHDSHEAHEL